MEIPLKRKYRTAFKSRYKSSSGNNNPSKHRGETDKNRRDAAMLATQINQRVMLLQPNGKIKFILASTL